MPLSAAAMRGIEVYGHRWRFEISFAGQMERLGDEDDLKAGDAAAIRDDIARRLKTFAEIARRMDADLADKIVTHAEDLEMVDDDPDELKAELNDLYDTFDFYRVCVVR